MVISRNWFLIFGAMIGVVLFGGYEALGIEKLPYRVVEKEGSFELRQYDAYLVAETIVDGDFEKVGNEGFRRLVKYIKGANQKEASIAMTAPVNQEAAADQITPFPVKQEQIGGSWRIAFVMPASYTLAILPAPQDERIRIKQRSGFLAAAVRYSGMWRQEAYAEKKKLLLKWIDQKSLKIIGNPVWARYDPPFMPWFLRRNEVLIPVQKSKPRL
jgi:hypothetical protein